MESAYTKEMESGFLYVCGRPIYSISRCWTLSELSQEDRVNLRIPPGKHTCLMTK